MSKQNNLAIIPARGGSKRIPHKNIKLFFGKPIIQYSIEAALKSGCFSEVMVSTDNPQIARIAKKAGASVPFLRSDNSSGDESPVKEVAVEVLKEYAKTGQKFDNFCCIFATAPFITVKDIKKAMTILTKSNDINSVFTVVKYGHPIQRSFVIKKGWLKMQWRKFINTRSQDLEPVYHDAGQFYCLKTKNFLKEKQFFAQKSQALILPETRVQDIDTLEDWQIAEIKFEILKKPLDLARGKGVR